MGSNIPLFIRYLYCDQLHCDDNVLAFPRTSEAAECRAGPGGGGEGSKDQRFPVSTIRAVVFWIYE